MLPVTGRKKPGGRPTQRTHELGARPRWTLSTTVARLPHRTSLVPRPVGAAARGGCKLEGGTCMRYVG